MMRKWIVAASMLACVGQTQAQSVQDAMEEDAMYVAALAHCMEVHKIFGRAEWTDVTNAFGRLYGHLNMRPALTAAVRFIEEEKSSRTDCKLLYDKYWAGAWPMDERTK